VSLSSWLPPGLRVRFRFWRGDLAAFQGALVAPRRPVVRIPHTPAELRALHVAATAARAALPPRAALPGALRAEFRDLELVAVARPTSDAVTLVFRNPPDAPVTFRPGQYLTLVVAQGGESLHRAYSLCSDPADREHLAVTVKRVAGGRLSNLLNDTAAVGQRYRVLGPSGRFGTTPRQNAARRVVLVAAGAGVTPLFSIAQALAAGEPLSRIELVCGNRRVADILFRPELEHLAAAHPNLRVTHALTRAPRGWRGARGRLAGERLAALVPVDPAAEYYVCGPEGMMQGVVAYLRAAGVPAGHVFVERFVRQDAAAHGGTGAVHEVRFARRGIVLRVPDTKTLLEASLEAGLALAFSCTMGGCAACKVRVLEGELDQEEPNCLTAEEAARGGRLACVGRPRSALVVDA
jgi:ferredoxin-NADP reductase